MKAIDAYNLLFQAMLSRDVTSTERREIADRFGETDVDAKDIAIEIIRSSEFFGLHRESFIDRQFPTSTVVTARGPLGHQIHCDLRQLHLGLSMACGHYEPDETAFIRKHVSKGMTALDVGANIGFFTTMMAGLVGESGKVIALEPVNDTFQKLSSAVALNRQQSIVELHNVAASSGEGSFELTYDLNSFNMGGVSLRREGDNNRLRITQKAVTSRIDDLVWGRPIHFMKMDIEGAEGIALDGAFETLSSSKPLIIMEFNENQLRQVSRISAAELFRKVLNFGYSGHAIRSQGETSPLTEASLSESTKSGKIVNVAFVPT
ncbi:FkbM family methyltransferase [Agrobacterium rosae]|uniref:FkbM family methyltransferase n=1 Tax=Agrobacterium rosae TaxID=1972867 RepID=UPI003B9FB3A0